MSKLSKYLWWSTVVFSLAILFAPLIINGNFYFPFIVPRNLFFRMLVELSFFSYLILIILDQNFRPKFNKAYLIFLFFILSLTISSLLAGNFGFSFWSNFERMDGLLNWYHLAAYVFVLLGIFGHDQKKIFLFLKISLIPAFLVALIAVGQRLNLSFVLESSGGTRLASTLGNAAYVGSYMFLHIIIALYLFFKEKAKKYWQFIYAFLIILFTWTLIGTSTRGSFLGLILFIFLLGLFFLWFKRKQKNLQYWLVLSLAAISIIFVVALFLQKDSAWVKGVPLFSKIANISLTDTTTQSRLVIWRNSLSGFQGKPIFGWGEENFTQVFNKYFPIEIFHDTGSEVWFDRPHNILVQHLIQGGIVGLGLYLGIFIYLIILLYRRQKKDQDWLSFSFWSAFLLSFLFQDLFIFDNVNVNVVFYFILSFLFSLDAKVYFAKYSWKKYQKIFVLLSFCLFLLSLNFFIIRPYYANTLLVQTLQAVPVINNDQDLEIVLKNWEKSFKLTRQGDKEKVQNLYRLSLTFAQNQNLSVEARSNFILATENYFEILKNRYPQDVRSNLFLSNFYQSLSSFKPEYIEKNISLLNHLQELAPNRPDILLNLTTAYLMSGKIEEAQISADHLRDLAPWAKAVYWNSFKVDTSLGDFEKIKKDLDKIVEINQSSSKLNFTEQELGQINSFLAYVQENDNQALEDLLLKYLSLKNE
ncbi:O-antigen ligase family protein [Candidatus Nomurabacteria bacterium]|nr:O-antigen ligase family protein [Candidatus Nomurabacteria bacterium]